jgi:L-alanine-DL-glutamate epimerase-like enolase superfamily enzyme
MLQGMKWNHRAAHERQSGMKIRHIEPIAVSLPLEHPLKMAGVEIATSENLLVRVESDDGAIGWGESAAAPQMTGETPQGMVAAVRYLAPALLGRDAADIAGATARMDARMYGNQSAKAAIEIALHDLVGRATGKPVYELLGGKRRGRIPVMWMIGTGDTEADFAEAADKKAAGFVAYKIKVGVVGLREDIRRTIGICERLGDGMLISADANQGYSVAEAVEYVRAVERTPLAFFEQPVRENDFTGLAQIARASRIPIGVDEGLHAPLYIRLHHEAHAAAGGSLKTIKFGGLRPVLAAAQLCESLNWKVNLACKAAESSVAAAAILHLAAVVPALDWGMSLTNQYLADDLTRSPIAVVAGHASVPDAPGLGVEVDEARVRKYRLRL